MHELPQDQREFPHPLAGGVSGRQVPRMEILAHPQRLPQAGAEL
jgi:hypothetical protein